VQPRRLFEVMTDQAVYSTLTPRVYDAIMHAVDPASMDKLIEEVSESDDEVIDALRDDEAKSSIWKRRVANLSSFSSGRHSDVSV